MTLRVLGCAEVPLGRQDGAAAHVRGLYSWFARLGAEVACLVPETLPPDASPGFRVLFVPSGEKATRWTFSWHVLAPLWFAYWLVRFRPDVVYLRGHLLLPYVLMARLKGVPAAVEVNEEKAGELAWQGAWRRRMAGVIGWIDRLVYANATVLFPVTPQLRDLLVKEYGANAAKCVVVSNGFDPTIFYPRPKDAAAAEVGLDPSRRYLVFVSRLTPRHSLDLLLDGFALLAGRREDVDLVVVGDGPSLPAMSQRAAALGLARRVHFTGGVPESQAADFIRASECGIAQLRADRNASRVGASPLKVWAYLGCARPVLAGEVPNLAETIRAWHCGMVLEEETPETFAGAAEWILDHPQEAKEMGRRGRAHALEGYTWEAVARKTLQPLKEIAHVS